ncbi:MAG: VWA domain-containing protein [Candidatus Sulfotelmatobacter sp.]
MVFVNGEATSRGIPRNRSYRLVVAVCVTLLVACLPIGAQPSGNQAPAGQSSQSQPPQSGDIPDAPSAVQVPTDNPEPPPIPRPEEKKPAVERNPWTNQPVNQPTSAQPGTQPADSSSNEATPPPMPPVKTIPPGSTSKTGSNPQEDLYKLKVTTNFVEVPVTVKDKSGRPVDGLISSDFVVKENGTVQKLTYFTSDPFALSVAIVLDLGMPDTAVQKVNQTFPALVGAFAPYDEVALYTYSSTVSQVTDFSGVNQKLAALLNQMKTVRGHDNGAPVLGGPLAQNGPIVNGIPVDSPTPPVNTPPKEAHVLNDAILKAALDLSRHDRDRKRRKIIFVISDGREFGSKASYNDVKRVLLSNEVQVKAVAVETSALPVYRKIERLHIPDQGYSNILPKYTSATGGGTPYSELTRNAIADAYSEVMSDARNQYTLGYTPSRPKTPTSSAYRNIEVVVTRPGLKIYARDGYYPLPPARQ